MESYNEFIAGNGNLQSQISSGKNPMPTSQVHAFENMSSKADLYDHMQTNL